MVPLFQPILSFIEQLFFIQLLSPLASLRLPLLPQQVSRFIEELP